MVRVMAKTSGLWSRRYPMTEPYVVKPISFTPYPAQFWLELNTKWTGSKSYSHDRHIDMIVIFT